jgi:outer membrane autotransporter protein
VVQTADPATAAQTGNQAQTATGVDSLPATGDVPTAVLNTPDPVTTRGAFDQLSGAALASANSLMISGSVLVRDTTFDRLRDVFCATPDDNRHTGCVAFADRPTVWAQGFGGWNQIYGNGNAAGISQTSGGFLVGADVPVQDWRIGMFGGYSRSDFTSGARDAQGRSNSYHLGAYGGTAWGDLGLRLGASYSWNGLATERLVAFDDFSNDLRATYNAGTTQFFTELGQKIALDGLLVEPFANLAYVNLHTGGFRETGGAAALTSRANTLEDTFATLGARPSTEISLGDTAIVARGMLGWRHTFGDMRPASVVSFDGGSAFTVAGVPIARDAGVAEAGVSINLSDTAALGLTYGGQFSNRETDHSIRGTLAITF